MKTAFVADLHVWNHRVYGGSFHAGLNDRCRMALDVLKRAQEVASAHDCYGGMVAAGDIFDGVKPSPQMIAEVQDIMEKSVWHLIKGNHDAASSAPGDHALAPLWPVAQIYEGPTVIEMAGDSTEWDLLAVPYQPGAASEWFPPAVADLAEQSKRKMKVLCFHLGIEDEKTDVWLSGAHDSIPLGVLEKLMKEHGILTCFAGNWHDHRHWYVIDGKHDVVQCGTLIPTGFDNPGVEGYGQLCMFDPDAEPGKMVSFVEIPGPRFLKVSGPNAESYIRVAKDEGNTVFVKWTSKSEGYAAAEETLTAWKEQGIVDAGGVFPDEDEVEEKAREAAEAAKSATTLESALAAFIEKMELGIEGIDPALVLEMCKTLLKLGDDDATSSQKSLSVRNIKLSNFMAYDDADFDFPASGIVLVTGENGQGKSSVVESVVAGCWNKTLRKTPWYRPGEVSKVELSMYHPDITIERERTRGGSNKFKIVGGTEYDTATKAQKYLNELIPDLDIWRKTSVFTSASLEGLNFTGLGDGGQKRLIEQLVGVTRFEPALKECRKKLSAAEKELEKVRHRIEIADVKIESEQKRQDEAVAERDELVVPTKPEERRAQIQDAWEAAKLDDKHLVAARHRLQRAGVKQAAEIEQLEKRLKRLSSMNCPECVQPVPEELRDDLQKKVEALQAEITKAKEDADAELGYIIDQIEELAEEIEFCRTEFVTATQSVRAYEDAKKRRDKIDTTIRETTMTITRLSSERGQAIAAARQYEEAVLVLKAAERVLGLKGVRAHIVGQTLQGVQYIANRWLQKMGEIQIELKENRIGSDGQVIDELDLVIHGAGGGFGYNACSMGERRRVDVSILLALAKISQAAHGMGDGMLFFDEVFDILDEPGTVGVAAALTELAETRCIVVISHAEKVQRAIEPHLHFHIEGGRLLEAA